MTTPIITVRKWDALDNPECQNCGGLARPIRPKPPCNTILIQLVLSPKARLRRQLQSIVTRAAIPKDRLAHCILGMTAPTLWRHLKQGGIPQATRDQIQSIEYIKRDGNKVYVIYDVGNIGSKWEATLVRRTRAARRKENACVFSK